MGFCLLAKPRGSKSTSSLIGLDPRSAPPDPTTTTTTTTTSYHQVGRCLDALHRHHHSGKGRERSSASLHPDPASGAAPEYLRVGDWSSTNGRTSPRSRYCYASHGQPCFIPRAQEGSFSLRLHEGLRQLIALRVVSHVAWVPTHRHNLHHHHLHQRADPSTRPSYLRLRSGLRWIPTGVNFITM